MKLLATRPVTTFASVALAAVTWAAPQGFGGKTDPGPSFAGGQTPSLPIFQTIIALGIVAVILKFVLPRAVGWLARRTTSASGSSIRVEATSVVGAAALHVVRVEGRKLLIGVTAQHVSRLAEWPEGLDEEPVFVEVLDQAIKAPQAKAVIIDAPQAAHRTKPSARVRTQEEAEDALRRLRRLAG